MNFHTGVHILPKEPLNAKTLVQILSVFYCLVNFKYCYHRVSVKCE